MTATAVLVGALVVVGVRITHEGRVLPGVDVAGIALGGADRAAVRTALERLIQRPVVVTIDGQRRRIDPGAAGRVVDLDATVAAAMRSGRDGPAAGVWPTATAVLGARRAVPLVAEVDRRKLRAVVAGLASRLDRPPFHGSVTVASDTLEVSTRAPRPGRTVARARLRRALHRALLSGETEVRAQVRRRPAATAASVAAAGRAAARYVRRPLELRLGTTAVRLPPHRVAPVLGVEVTAGREAVLGPRSSKLASLVADVSRDWDRAPRRPRVRAPRRPFVLDDKGDVSWGPRRVSVGVDAGRPGRAVDRRAATAALAAAIRSGRHVASVPVRSVPSDLSTADARRVRFLIGTFTTYYDPGQPRVTNIRRIARAVDGTVVAPGASFSLNDVAGPRTRAKGYVAAPFIADGKIVPSIGGGVSQLSTTMYNAAYFAGLRLDRHQPHSLFIDRYPPGRESTLNFPDIDLRWSNDTDAPVLVRAATDRTSVTVSLYGDNGRRRVRAITGARRPIAGRDFAITVTRVIRHRDGRIARQPVTTTYDRPSDDE